MARCYVEIAPGFENYGGRGIAVADVWQTFKTFAFDMGDKKPVGMTLDRIDNDADYSFENCKWSSHSEQMLNRRQFGNNTSGETGVVRIGDKFEARYHFEGVRYRLGRYDTSIAAKLARNEFAKLFAKDRLAAIATVSTPTVWCTSETKIRGVSKHKDGGFVVRVTQNKVRKYVGYFQTLSEAIDARREFDKE